MIQAADVNIADWPLPNGVRAIITTRRGGVSGGAYESLNLGLHVGDDPLAVDENRRRVGQLMPGAPLWLDQVHGTRVFRIGQDAEGQGPPRADAATTRLVARPCAVMVADCLPVLFCEETGACVAAAHAGWRGLAAGVIERTVEAMAVAPRHLTAYLGPAIGPAAFEVGQDVVDIFARLGRESHSAFRPIAGRPGKYLADIYTLARQRLAVAGVEQVTGGGLCTLSAPDRFFSFRRDGQTGRMAAIIWRE
jgi:YfiH family protein